MDYTLDFVILGIAAILLPAIYGAPRFVLDVLKLRKKWREEFPDRKLEYFLRDVLSGRLNQRYIRKYLLIAAIRGFVIAPLDIGLITYSAYRASIGHPLPIVWLTAIDLWLVAMMVFALYLVYLSRPIFRMLWVARQFELAGKPPD